MSDLAHSPADIVRQLLIDVGVADFPIYASSEPSVPDNCLTVYNTQGTGQGRVMVGGEVQQHYGFQVRIRSKDHLTGWLKANSVQKVLAEIVYRNTVTLDVTAYLVQCIAGIGSILEIGTDAPKTKRHLFTLNALLSVRRVSAEEEAEWSGLDFSDVDDLALYPTLL